MKRSIIFETIVKKLRNVNKTKSYFTRNDLVNLISIHQKYSTFVYKHSDLKNEGNMTLYFIRGKKVNGLISFKIDSIILKDYLIYNPF